jgi:ribonuclease D
MAIAARLWEWREQAAEKRNIPVRRVLRDDLLVELARREAFKLQQLKLLRGMERRNYDRDLPEIAAVVAAAIQSPKDQWPAKPKWTTATPEFNLLGQFLHSALSILCRDLGLSTALVGTAQDLRKLVAWHLKVSESPEPPRLARGWRAKIVGNTIQDMLTGRWAIAVENPLDEQPLRLLSTDRPASSTT